MRKEGVVLEHEAKAAAMHGHGGEVLPAQADLALVGMFQPGDDAQQRRFAAAAWPQEADDLAGVHGQADPLQRGGGAGIGFVQIGDL